MNKSCVYILIISLTALISCSEKRSFNLKGSIVLQYPVLFNTSQSKLSDRKISCNFQLRAKLNGDSLFLAVLIDNKSNDSLKINPDDLQIETTNNIISDVAWRDIRKLVIPPKSTITSTFKFAPFNNITLCDRINYNGDMKSIYFININFIHLNNGKKLFGERVMFYLDNDNYNNYKDNYAIENRIKLFQLKNKNELKEKLISNVKALNLKNYIKNESNGVITTITDIIIEGAVIKLNFYRLDSNLILLSNVINNGEHVLKLNPEQFQINESGKVIHPQIISILNSIPSKDITNYFIKPGTSLDMKLNYMGVNNKEFLLLNKGLIFMDVNKELFPEPITFEIHTTYSN